MDLQQKHFDGGKLAYDAYCKQTGGVSLISGDKLPAFDALKQEIREAWAAAYIAVGREEGRHMRPALLACRNRFETIKETNPEIHLNDDIALIDRALAR